MSRPGVGMVIEKLVTVESVRIRFALDPMRRSPSCVCEALSSRATRSTSCVGRMLGCGSSGTRSLASGSTDDRRGSFGLDLWPTQRRQCHGDLR